MCYGCNACDVYMHVPSCICECACMECTHTYTYIHTHVTLCICECVCMECIHTYTDIHGHTHAHACTPHAHQSVAMAVLINLALAGQIKKMEHIRDVFANVLHRRQGGCWKPQNVHKSPSKLWRLSWYGFAHTYTHQAIDTSAQG